MRPRHAKGPRKPSLRSPNEGAWMFVFGLVTLTGVELAVEHVCPRTKCRPLSETVVRDNRRTGTDGSTPDGLFTN